MVMESILQSTEIRRLKRALFVLEGLTYLSDDDVLFARVKSESAEKVCERFEGFVNSVYKITHAATCHCTDYNDWLLEIEKWEEILLRLNILDTSKYMGVGD